MTTGSSGETGGPYVEEQNWALISYLVQNGSKAPLQIQNFEIIRVKSKEKSSK